MHRLPQLQLQYLNLFSHLISTVEPEYVARLQKRASAVGLRVVTWWVSRMLRLLVVTPRVTTNVIHSSNVLLRA